VKVSPTTENMSAHHGDSSRKKSETWSLKTRPRGDEENLRSQDNAVHTTKYNIITWLPKSLFMQFKRVANVYFLMISVLMLIGRYVHEAYQTPLDPFSTIITFVFVLGVTCVKEASEDMKRFQSDRFENEKEVIVVTWENGTYKETKKACQEVKGGDIVKLKNGEPCPCDLLLCMSSSYEDGNQCYVETANIDGETNLKLKFAPPELHGLWNADGSPQVELFDGSIDFLEPDNKIHIFEGRYMNNKIRDPIPLGPSNVLLRTSLFSNTDWGYGIAIYCGQETKIQMNSKDPEMKMSNIDKLANHAIMMVFACQLILCSITVISMYAMNFDDTNKMLPYAYPGNSGSKSKLPMWMEYWFIFFLLFNNFIPISLYVTIELVNVGQAAMIASDEQIYDSRPDMDVPCAVKSSNLAQELGMVSNIFSDKTGTLTQNRMELVKFVVKGQLYDVGEAAIESGTSTDLPGTCLPKDDTIHDFLRCLATCHTVIREKGGGLRAESPDEEAIVVAASKLNCSVEERGTVSMKCSIFGDMQDYDVLAVNAFNSDRKRMSVLLRTHKTGEYLLVCKGADNIMAPLCNTDKSTTEWLEKTLVDLACLGLRTLVISQKKLSIAQAEAWIQQYNDAASSMTDRDGLLAQAGKDLEVGMELLGITAIEDKLQDEVPEVIADLAKAGIVVWMLTGDKEQTAINIGRSCNLVLTDSKLFFLVGLQRHPSDDTHNDKCYSTFETQMKDIYDDIEENWVEGEDPERSGYYDKETKAFVSIVLVLDGPSFDFFNFDSEDQIKWFLRIGKAVRAVISCRLTPSQKESVVDLVKSNTVPKATCLAIGDGANDVPMILKGDVGVGIYGREGRQAANNADFAIGQFKFLRRLLLVHGRWNYIRQANVFLYSLHKNAVITLMLFWFCYFTSVSGSTPFQSYIYAAYNLGLGLPIIFYGILDRDLPDSFVLKYPAVYETGKANLLLGGANVIGWILNVIGYSVLLCLLFYYACRGSFSDDAIFIAGTVVYTGLMFSMQTKIIFMHHQWAYPQIVIMALSVFGLFLGYLIVQTFVYDTFYNAVPYLYSIPIFWFFGCFTAPLLTMLFEAIIWYFRLLFYPDKEMLYREVYYRVRLSKDYLPFADSDLKNMGIVGDKKATPAPASEPANYTEM
jgi:magnesium-transporting ATPase (P-type)